MSLQEQRFTFDSSAKWITPEEKTNPDVQGPAGYLRRAFRYSRKAAGEGSRAVFFCTAHGLYNACLNGKKIGDRVLAPGCDDYRKRLCVQQYDVTQLLVEGENELTVVLGDGWYRGCIGIDSTRNFYGDDLSFLCELITEPRGEKEGSRTGNEEENDHRLLLVSDASFEGSQSGPIRMTDLEEGEIFDARMEEIADWHPVRVLDLNQELILSDAPAIRERESFDGKILHTPNGETVIDFGQNLAGYTALSADAHEGQEIRLIHGEALDENGNFTIQNFQPDIRKPADKKPEGAGSTSAGKCKMEGSGAADASAAARSEFLPARQNKMGGIRQEIQYICKEGHNEYQPSFSIFGFRYAKLVTDIPLEKLRFRSIAVYSDMAEKTTFECSDAKVNRLFQNCMWSMKSNFCDIPTDCPTRERAGWTGDAGVFAAAGLRLMECAPVYEKWLANLRLNQFEDGELPYICPPNGPSGQMASLFRASVGWGDACVIVPWEIYRLSGDTDVLRENYEMMTKWIHFLMARAKQKRNPDPYDGNPLQDFIINTGMDYGEWAEPDANTMADMQRAFAVGQPEIATAYFAYSSGLVSRIAGILGLEDDRAFYSEIAAKAKDAWRSLYVKDGHIRPDRPGRQCSYVRPIAFGLLTPAEAQTAADDLAELVRAGGDRLNTGFLSTPYLCPALTAYGHADTAYHLLLGENCPGWLYEVNRGATTIWENWDGVREDGSLSGSLNHYSKGTIALWLLENVCGIQYDKDGLVIAPNPDPTYTLRYARASFASPAGNICAGWTYRAEKSADASHSLAYHVEIPDGMTARVLLPGKEAITVHGGVHEFEGVGGLTYRKVAF